MENRQSPVKQQRSVFRHKADAVIIENRMTSSADLCKAQDLNYNCNNVGVPMSLSKYWTVGYLAIGVAPVRDRAVIIIIDAL